jgi:hypothetical protein
MLSIIITGTTRENIIAKIMPGITNAINPAMMRMPVIMLTAKSTSKRDRVNLKLVRRFDALFSSVSEANFMTMP